LLNNQWPLFLKIEPADLHFNKVMCRHCPKVCWNGGDSHQTYL